MPKRFKGGSVIVPRGPLPIKRKLAHAQAVSTTFRKKPVTLPKLPESKP